MILAVVLAMALAGCSGTGVGTSPAHPAATHQTSPPARPAASAGAPAGPRVPAQVAAIVGAMTVPEKVGQLLVSTVPGYTAAAGGAALVRQYHLGGVVYFANNLSHASQVAALSAGLQDAARSQHPAIPLLIGTDQEGGIVSRLTGITTGFPGQMAAGATGDPAMIRAQEQVTGSQMQALGINLDYAPVADVNVDPANPVIGIRSFGSSPALVAQLTAAAIDGFHQAGEAATAKHFPGHGDTATDSHTGLPVIHHTLSQWWQIDAPPFEAAIRAGVDEIMIAHIIVPALDSSGQPASLSPKIVTGLLRDKLGYQGVVTTDSLQMAGVLQGHTPAQVAVQAIQAGCDQLLMPGNPAVAYQAVLQAVRDGRISMRQLDTSVARIISLKAARGLLNHPAGSSSAAASAVNTLMQRNVAEQLARHSVTMVRNRPVAGAARPVLPLGAGQHVYLADLAGTGLAGPLQADLPGGQLVASPGAADVIVVATSNAVSDPAQQRQVAALAASGKPVVVVATGLPYDLGLFPGAAAALATYSGSGASVAAAAAVLAGQYRPTGRLPVSIPAASGGTAFPYGTGLGY
jgi:beta-glucosidase-like glycosyl hydrolase